MRRISETVSHQVHSASTPDGHGNPTDDWASGVDVGVYAFDPGSSNAILIPGQGRVITTPTVFVPAAVTFAPRDRVTARGLLYEVDGDTAVWRHPDGLRPGNVIPLKRVTG